MFSECHRPTEFTESHRLKNFSDCRRPAEVTESRRPKKAATLKKGKVLERKSIKGRGYVAGFSESLP